MMYEFAGGWFLELTENKRSDQLLFDYYTGIWGMTLEDALAKGRHDFEFTGKPANFTLVISHHKRMKINRERNNQQRASNAILFERQKGLDKIMGLKICGFGKDLGL